MRGQTRGLTGLGRGMGWPLALGLNSVPVTLTQASQIASAILLVRLYWDYCSPTRGKGIDSPYTVVPHSAPTAALDRGQANWVMIRL